MKRITAIFFLILFGASATPSSVNATSDTQIKRKVLALYKGSEGDSQNTNLVLSLLEQPLDSLGVVVDYYDADKSLPSDQQMQSYRGVVTFFKTSTIQNPSGYASWIKKQVNSGRRVVIFGTYGAFESPSKVFMSHGTINTAFNALGLRYDGFWTDNLGVVSVDAVDTKMMGFEEPFSQEKLKSYVWVKSIDPSAVSYLRLHRTDIANSQSDVAVITRTGGYVDGGCLFKDYKQGGETKQRWLLNPTAFLRKALALESEPYFDVASLNGRRLFIAHIDGDGFTTPSNMGGSCAKVMTEQILKRFPFPFSVSVITAEVASGTQFIDQARAIFSLSHVEAANHSKSHPLDWTHLPSGETSEINDSFKFINEKLMPQGKKAKLFMWSGLSNPKESALKKLEAFGSYNMNGPNKDGGFVNRFDALFPSRSYLGPAVRRVGSEIQFNHRAANDYALTNSWTENDRDLYDHIVETFEHTSWDPEIPAHAYFHFYSAQTSKSLSSLTRVMEWALSQRLSSVYVTEYIDMVRDFREAKLTQLADGRIQITNKGFCRTVVFPQLKKKIDFANSRNIIGSLDRFGNTYVFLDENSEHVVAFSEGPQEKKPLLISGTGWINDWIVEDESIQFLTRGPGRKEIVIGGLRAGQHFLFKVASYDPASGRASLQEITTKEVVRSKEGQVTLRFESWTGSDRVTLEPIGFPKYLAMQAGVPISIIFISLFSIYFALPFWKSK